MRGPRSSLLNVIALSWVLVALTSMTARAESIPLGMQAVLLKKVLMFDRTIQGAPKLAIVCDDPAAQETLRRAFGDVGMAGQMLKSSQADALAGSNVVYVMGPVSKELKDAAARFKVLSLSGSVEHAKAGDVAVAFEFGPGNRPVILVNNTTAKKQGHELSSDLLKMATLVD